jgi:hypothetical protein
MRSKEQALPLPVRATAERFFGADLSTVSVRTSWAPLKYSSVAFTEGDTIHFLPGLFDAGSQSGLRLLGHELTHVVQQRNGIAAARGLSPGAVLDVAELEAEADELGSEFADACVAGQIARVRRPSVRKRSAARLGTGVVQCKVWEPGREVKPNDEFFWHCTTFPSVTKLYQADKLTIKLGGGWQGPGFYVTTQRSDYVKIMALRNNQKEPHPLLFFLYLLVEDFYNLTAVFQDDFGVPAGNPDVVGVRWGGNIKGPFGKPEQTIKMPEGTRGRATLPGGHAVIGGYQGEEMWTVGMKLDNPDSYNPQKWFDDTPGRGGRSMAFTGNAVGWRNKELAQHAALDALWQLAQQNNRNGNTGNAQLDLLVRMLGPRKAFLGTLEELTFVSERCASRVHVVGARVFSETPTRMYSDLGPDLVTSETPYGGSYSEARIDFDNDKWVDMDFLEQLIQQHLNPRSAASAAAAARK